MLWLRYVVLAASLLVAYPASLHAQRAERVLRRPIAASRPSPSVGEEVLVRSLSSAMLGYVGFGVGVLIAYSSVPHRGRRDDTGLSEAHIGGAIGVAMGAAAGAAFPRVGNTCRAGSRFGRALLASGATMGLTMLAGREGRPSPLVLGLIAATPLAAGIAATLCDSVP